MGSISQRIHFCTGTRLEHESVFQTVISSAEDASLALTFNVASQALNNSYFLDNLVSDSVLYRLYVPIDTDVFSPTETSPTRTTPR